MRIARKSMNQYVRDKVTAGLINQAEADIINTCMDEYSAMKSVKEETFRNRYFFLFTLTGILHTTGITLPECKTSHVLKAATLIKQGPYAVSYQITLITLLKVFANYLNVDMQKVAAIEPPRQEGKSKRPEDMLTREEVQRVLDACLNSRDRCLIAMLYDGSNRIVEPLSLDWKDLIKDDIGYYIDTKAKTGKQRKIRYTMAVPFIEQWQSDYPGTAAGDNPVFISLKKPIRRMTKAAYDKRIEDIRNATWIKKLIPSIMRSTRITHDVEAGYDPQYIMLKNWGSLKTKMLDHYTNLSGDYIDQKALEYAGMKRADKKEVVDPLQPIQCPKCHTVNEAGREFCRKCGESFTGFDQMAELLKAMKRANERIEALERERK